MSGPLVGFTDLQSMVANRQRRRTAAESSFRETALMLSLAVALLVIIAAGFAHRTGETIESDSDHAIEAITWL